MIITRGFGLKCDVSADYIDPLEENVRETIIYKFDGINKTGILDLPAIADVRDGVVYDNATKSGISDQAFESDVRDGIKYDNLTKEGISDHALESDVRKDVKYDNLTKSGILEVSGVTEESIYNYFINGTREDVFKADLTGLESVVSRILGLSQSNYRIFSPIYDSNKNLLTAIIKIYNNKADCDNDINILETYDILATYDSESRMLTYKVTNV